MSRGLRWRALALVSFPRVSGDEPQPLGETTADGEFSPRERG